MNKRSNKARAEQARGVELLDDTEDGMLTVTEVRALKSLARDYQRARWLVATLTAAGTMLGAFAWVPEILDKLRHTQ